MEQRTFSVKNAVLLPQIKTFLQEGHTARFRVRGWSMRIFVEHERDEVLLTAPQTETLKRGDVVLAEIQPSVFVLHRIIKVEGDHITLQGDGNVGTKEYCQRKDVLGIALGFYRKGREVPDLTTSLKWKVYSTIWLTLTPLRRYILGAYRRIWLRFFKPI